MPGPRHPPGVLALVAVGGALGALARYEINTLIHVARGSFPWATFWINVSGSLALGVVLSVISKDRPLRSLLGAGFLGAFTTFSTFSVDIDLLVKDGHLAVAVIYALTSLACGIAAGWIGLLGGRWVAPRNQPA